VWQLGNRLKDREGGARDGPAGVARRSVTDGVDGRDAAEPQDAALPPVIDPRARVAALDRDTLPMMKHDQAEVFYCVPDKMGAQAHFWDGDSGLLCRPPKGAAPAKRARCRRHLAEAEKAVGRSKRR
jgi:hypothetical protein